MRVVLLARDLIIASRVREAGARADTEVTRVDAPTALPDAAAVDLLLVDWADREPEWGDQLAAWRDTATGQPPRVILFGPHSDLEAHAAARSAGIGPMLARSKLVSSLDELLT